MVVVWLMFLMMMQNDICSNSLISSQICGRALEAVHDIWPVTNYPTHVYLSINPMYRVVRSHHNFIQLI